MRRNIVSIVFAISSFLVIACSSDSGSGTNPVNPTNSSTSTCALANQYLPEYSPLSYTDAFGGGCQAVSTTNVEQATEYSNLLVANGFEQTIQSVDSYSYKKKCQYRLHYISDFIIFTRFFDCFRARNGS